ncbi:MAG: PIG-L family deacetylase [Planctomycetes bacterium]|nr:PIG-L family deacetylase [Planctomycetota bacterium]
MQDHRTVLAVGAHPDDIEFMCAGTLARLRSKGYRIHLVTMTAGDCGSDKLSPEEITGIRLGEAAASAAVLDASYACCHEKDIQIEYTNAVRRKVLGEIRRVNPSIVLTHPPQDYMADHEITSLVVRDVCFTGPMKNYMAEVGKPTDGIPWLYYWDPLECKDWTGKSVEPQFCIDITESLETKAKMLACHDTQRSWLRIQHGMDEYLEKMRQWSAFRGRQCGVGYAEGFRQHLGHAYPQTNFLGEVLGIVESSDTRAPLSPTRPA